MESCADVGLQLARDVVEHLFTLVALGLQARGQRLGLALEEGFQRIQAAAHGVLDLGGLARQRVFQTGEAGLVILDLGAEEDLADLVHAGAAGLGGFGNRRFYRMRLG